MQFKNMRTIVLAANMLDFIAILVMHLSVIHLDDSSQEKLISLKSSSQLLFFVLLNTMLFETFGNASFLCLFFEEGGN